MVKLMVNFCPGQYSVNWTVSYLPWSLECQLDSQLSALVTRVSAGGSLTGICCRIQLHGNLSALVTRSADWLVICLVTKVSAGGSIICPGH